MTANDNPNNQQDSGAAVTQQESTPEQGSSPKSIVLPGSISDVKNIYRAPKDQDGVWAWVSKYPEDVQEAAENEETAQYAVLVRNIKSSDSRKKLEAHSIVIQSPWLKIALGKILKDYPGVACDLERLVFEAPFKAFVHRWRDFVKYREEEALLDDTTKEHLTILYDILQYEIGDSIKAFEDYVEKGVVTYEHLWMVLQPGSPILAAYKGPLSAFELDDMAYMETRCGKFLRLHSDCIDYNGKSFRRARENIDIPEFFGTKKILELSAYPLSFHPRPDEIKDSLVKRGELFESLGGHHYKSYSGAAITWDREGNEQPIEVSGRIIVDIESFDRFSPINFIRQRRFREWKPSDQVLLLPGIVSNDRAGGGVKLSPYHRMLARCRTGGYSLKLKKWLDFFVDQVGDIQFSDHAFDSLVLPDDQKELIMAFSESQLEGGCAFDDVISGKGKGVICLLSGSPGVGKTLTAEAVAENLRVPLHTLSSGDLGSNPHEVERILQGILELVARWNAILLLDECDVFLEARSSHDLERNKVVSIFLRTLEYYEGILFMTTNRVNNIYPAFQSRIHVSLEYPDLTPASRRQVWQNFLAAANANATVGGGGGAAAKAELSDADLDDFALLDLNGRQIKNILKTSQLLASRKKEPLKRSFVDTILAIEKRRPEVHRASLVDPERVERIRPGTVVYINETDV
ncbi:ATP-dependent zinc metalloprotease FtsH [Apiospora arundinis]|uniref:ATP-dependent zinc metalloprotease FtsH n=1 Tax=Apiospora arundinis TaxID=335852 RepID=A0ABR2JHE8_9PEZI